jgi:hypothetical protein
VDNAKLAMLSLLRHPGAAVDELAHRVQVACVAGRLGDDVEDDLSQVP